MLTLFLDKENVDVYYTKGVKQALDFNNFSLVSSRTFTSKPSHYHSILLSLKLILFLWDMFKTVTAGIYTSTVIIATNKQTVDSTITQCGMEGSPRSRKRRTVRISDNDPEEIDVRISKDKVLVNERNDSVGVSSNKAVIKSALKKVRSCKVLHRSCTYQL